MKKAWIENEVIRDICHNGNPFECYVAELAVLYDTDVPDDAQNGWQYVNGIASPQPIIAPIKMFTSQDFRTAMTLSEKVNWDNDATNAIKTVKIELSVPITEATASELLTFLLSNADISQTTANKILA